MRYLSDPNRTPVDRQCETGDYPAVEFLNIPPMDPRVSAPPLMSIDYAAQDWTSQVRHRPAVRS